MQHISEFRARLFQSWLEPWGYMFLKNDMADLPLSLFPLLIFLYKAQWNSSSIFLGYLGIIRTSRVWLMQHSLGPNNTFAIAALPHVHMTCGDERLTRAIPCSLSTKNWTNVHLLKGGGSSEGSPARGFMLVDGVGDIPISSHRCCSWLGLFPIHALIEVFQEVHISQNCFSLPSLWLREPRLH